jgi:hypothetical protein
MGQELTWNVSATTPNAAALRYQLVEQLQLFCRQLGR